jgi:hypothetical protein
MIVILLSILVLFPTSTDASFAGFFTSLSSIFSSASNSVSSGAPKPAVSQDAQSIPSEAIDLVDWSLAKANPNLGEHDMCFVMGARTVTDSKFSASVFPKDYILPTGAGVLVIGLAEKDESCLIIHTVLVDSDSITKSTEKAEKLASKWVVGELVKCQLAIPVPSELTHLCHPEFNVVAQKAKQSIAAKSKATPSKVK